MVLKQYELLFKSLSNAAENVYIFESDMDLDYSMWSDNAVEFFGFPEDYHYNTIKLWLEKIHPDDREGYMKEITAVFEGRKKKHHYQYRVKNRNGDYFWVECNGSIAKGENGENKIFAGIITRLDNQSKYDPLTKRLVIHQFYLREEKEEPYTILLFGMDKFRRVIHSYGFAKGNTLLNFMSDALGQPRLNQQIYRMNGDEFLVTIPKVSEEEVKKYFMEVQEEFQKKCEESHFSKDITFSGACDVFNPTENDKDTIMKRLEHTMEQAKALGGGQLVSFSEEIEIRHKRILQISQELEKSITNDFKGFEIYYQPVLSVQNEKISAVEALLRFHSEKLGMISPVEFIPILENNRSIIHVGIWVMEQVIRQNYIWNQKYGNISTAFNVSYQQLYDDSLIMKLIEIVKENKVNPNSVIIELTESCKVMHPESLSGMFGLLIQSGFKVALDDFGMMNSTLSILRDIPITTVKVDHSFVRTIALDNSQMDRANVAIISGIITMCKKLGYNTVVEGVETPAIAKMMKDLGAKFLQGYYYSKPVTAQEIETYFIH